MKGGFLTVSIKSAFLLMNSSGFFWDYAGFDLLPAAKFLMNLTGLAKRKMLKMFGVTEKVREGDISRISKSFWNQIICT